MSRTKIRVIAIMAVLVIGIFGMIYGDSLVRAELQGQQDQKAAIEAGEQGLSTFLKAISSDTYVDYGFKDESELETATLGEPLEAFLVASQSLESYKPGQRFSSLLMPARQWMFPVLANEQARTILRVAFFQDRWQAVEIGGAPEFADRLYTLTSQASSSTVLGNSPSIKLVEVQPIGGYFALVETAESKEVLIFLHAYKGVLSDVQTLKPYSPDEIVPKIAEEVRAAEHR